MVRESSVSGHGRRRRLNRRPTQPSRCAAGRVGVDRPALALGFLVRALGTRARPPGRRTAARTRAGGRRVAPLACLRAWRRATAAGLPARQGHGAERSSFEARRHRRVSWRATRHGSGACGSGTRCSGAGCRGGARSDARASSGGIEGRPDASGSGAVRTAGIAGFCRGRCVGEGGSAGSGAAAAGCCNGQRRGR